MSDTTLTDAADDVLDAAIAALTGETYGGEALLPDVTLVQTGATWAWDPCERLVVHVGSVEPHQPIPPGPPATAELASGCAVVPVATLNLTLLYCVPKAGDGDAAIPPAADITAAAERIQAGGMTLWRGITAARKDGTLITSTDIGCDAVALSTMETQGPQGGYAGWSLPLRINLLGSTSGS